MQTPPPSTLVEASDDYALLRWGNQALFNNLWGQEYLNSGSTYSGKIYYDTGSPLIGWEWSWPTDNPDQLKGYPALIIGDKPFPPPAFDASTDPRFPLYLPVMKELWIEGDIQVSGNGGYDFAYDLNLLEGSQSTPSAIRTEVMIWLDATKVCGAEFIGEYVIDAVTYDLYVNTDWNPSVSYLAFVRKGGLIPGRVPLHVFINTACQLGYCSTGAYLSAIELGPEIWWGSGQATLRNLNVSLVMN